MNRKYRKLSIEEVKDIQLQMLIEFDRFCRDNQITYFLSYGTLLGAIRHKGYIPWDDDIDVMVPRPEISKLKSYNSEKYQIIDTANQVGYEFPYPRMISKDTALIKNKYLKLYGVFIDIYPIDGLPIKEEDINTYRTQLKRIKNVRWIFIKIRNKLSKYLPIKTFPVIKFLTNLHSKKMVSIDYNKAKYVHVCNPNNPPIDKNLFKTAVDVEFEGYRMKAPVGWHDFLTNSYGDYMKLPPEKDRHPYHNPDSYYKIED